MKKTGKVNGQVNKLPAVISLGAAINLIFMFSGTAIGAYLIMNEKIDEDGIGTIATIIQFISAACGTAAVLKLCKNKRLMICMLSGVVYFLSQIAITGMFFDGQYSNLGSGILAVMCGCATVAVVGLLIGKRSSTTKKKYAYR